MNFVQVEFLWFFATVFTLYWLAPSLRWQNALLLVASSVFYGWVHPWFLILLYGAATLDYAAALAIDRSPRYARLILAVSLSTNLVLLGTFKYLDFFIENWLAAAELLGIRTDVRTLGLLLPAGISFYTFQTMSYTVDVYRKKMAPCADYLDYMVFVSFFPQLVAGPVERAVDLLPQVQRPRVFNLDRARSGLSLALFGAFKKVAIADTVAPYVDKVFSLTEPSFALVWVAVIGFTIQILTDFGGYTDIARGTARILGFELVENFRHPFIATSPTDFWRRWHISFSTWIRDYVYVPLVGGRNPTWARATMATWASMLVSGFWHGAAWNFVIWGAYFALITSIYREVEPRVPAVVRSAPGATAAAAALMYGLVCVAMLIFRAGPLDRLILFLTLDPFAQTPAQLGAAASLFAIVIACAAPLWVAMISDLWLRPRLVGSEWRWALRTTAATVHVLGIMSFPRTSAEDFIYFAF